MPHVLAAKPIRYLEILRRKRGMSQTELGELAGITQRRISDIEHGLTPTGDELEDIAYALEFSPPEVLWREVEIPAGTNGSAVRREHVFELFRELGIQVVD